MKEIGSGNLGAVVCENKECNFNNDLFYPFSKNALEGAAKKHEDATGHSTIVLLENIVLSDEARKEFVFQLLSKGWSGEHVNRILLNL